MNTDFIGVDNRMLLPLAPRDSWFNPPGIVDLATGRITRLDSSNRHDHPSSIWMPDGRILSLALGICASVWKFTPESAAK